MANFYTPTNVYGVILESACLSFFVSVWRSLSVYRISVIWCHKLLLQFCFSSNFAYTLIVFWRFARCNFEMSTPPGWGINICTWTLNSFQIVCFCQSVGVGHWGWGHLSHIQWQLYSLICPNWKVFFLYRRVRYESNGKNWFLNGRKQYMLHFLLFSWWFLPIKEQILSTVTCIHTDESKALLW